MPRASGCRVGIRARRSVVVVPVAVLRRSALLAAWSTAALRGEVPAERAMDVLAGDSPPLTFVADEGHGTFLESLARWRSSAITGWRYVPVAPGDAASLPGPRGFAASAMDAGAALVAVDGPLAGMVPVLGADAMTWTTHHVDDRGHAPPESPGDVERRLLVAVTESVTALEELEIAGWRDEVSDLFSSWHDADPTPPALSARAARLAARSARLLELCDLAAQDHGGSRTSGEAAARATVLHDVARAARAAHAAAWNEGLRSTSAARPPR